MLRLNSNPAREARLKTLFTQRIGATQFPCVGAKSAVSKDQLQVMVARDLTSAWDDLRIYRYLREFAIGYTKQPRLFTSFVVLFDGPRTLFEAQFEGHLWARLQSLHDKDIWHGQRRDNRVDLDPASPHFSLSFGGEAFFVIGLHPHASRKARRFACPALVFNLHDQFERLRADGRYTKLHDTIIGRDIALDGAANPMLTPFGAMSEARQYSGRVVNADWKCPFKPGVEAAVSPMLADVD